MKAIQIFIVVLFCSCSTICFGQDSLVRKKDKDSATTIKIDTNRIKRHNPKIATRRSLMIPGWGQAYNREYWKIPIVWGALGTAAGFWVYNNTWYKRSKYAFEQVVDTNTANYGQIHPRLKNQITGQPFDAFNLQRFRNEFRKNRDYSLLYFILLWGLNVADATVFGHLKEFDVSNDLSLKVNPTINPINGAAGLSLSLSAKQIKSSKKIFYEAR